MSAILITKASNEQYAKIENVIYWEEFMGMTGGKYPVIVQPNTFYGMAAEDLKEDFPHLDEKTLTVMTLLPFEAKIYDDYIE